MGVDGRGRLIPVFLLLTVIVAGGLLGFGAYAQQFTVAIDLSHGQPYEGVDVIVGTQPGVKWVLILASEAQREEVPSEILGLFDELRFGGFTGETLSGVDFLIIGQPTQLPTDEEIAAIASWFATGSKAIWVAGDSDYPAQGSETAQLAMNLILEAIGSSLRIDFISVEDDVEMAERPYRVKGIVDPDPEVSQIAEGLEEFRVLFHGPGALYVLVGGQPVNPLWSPELKPANVFVVVRSSDQSRAVENQPAEEGGFPFEFYDPLNDETNRGPYPLMMIEILGSNVVVASSETPYGGYEPMTATEYYGHPLDGPTFVGNVISFVLSKLVVVPVVTEFVTETVTETLVETETVERTITQTLATTLTVTTGPSTATLAAAIVIILLIVAAAYFLLRRG